MELVLLHGFGGSARSFDELIARLRAPARALDLPGHRGEEAPPPLATFEEAIGALATELSAYGAPLHLAGYSLGGRVALALAVAHPELIARLTLIGASPGLEREEERVRRRAGDEAWARLLEREGIEAFFTAWNAQPILAPASAVPEERIAARRAIQHSHPIAGLAWALRVLGLGAMPDLWPHVSRLAMPVELVVGGADAKFRAIAEAMLPRLSRAKLTVVPQAGHNVVLEDPAALASGFALSRGPQNGQGPANGD